MGVDLVWPSARELHPPTRRPWTQSCLFARTRSLPLYRPASARMPSPATDSRPSEPPSSDIDIDVDDEDVPRPAVLASSASASDDGDDDGGDDEDDDEVDQLADSSDAEVEADDEPAPAPTPVRPVSPPVEFEPSDAEDGAGPGKGKAKLVRRPGESVIPEEMLAAVLDAERMFTCHVELCGPLMAIPRRQ